MLEPGNMGWKIQFWCPQGDGTRGRFVRLPVLSERSRIIIQHSLRNGDLNGENGRWSKTIPEMRGGQQAGSKGWARGKQD